MQIVNIRQEHMNGGVVTIEYNTDGVGDSIVPETYIQCNNLTAGTNIIALGYSLTTGEAVNMKFADISGIGTVDMIENDGIYLILSSALQRLELSTAGECDLIIKQVAE